MTDKEKKSKIADILMDFQEEYSNEVINRPMLASLYAGNILSFINSLQKEPVSIWHDASENPKEEEHLMCVYKDNRYHIGKVYKDEFDRLLVSDNKNIIELCMFEKWAYIDDILNFSNVERTVKNLKEPISDDLKKASIIHSEIVRNTSVIDEDFIDGAQWQKRKDEYITEDLGEYINELSKQFPEVSFAKLSRIAVRVAKWQKEQFEINEK